MKILAVMPPYVGKADMVYFPIGFGLIISIVESEGHDVDVLDMHNHDLSMDVLEAKVRKDKYDICLMGGFATQVSSMKVITGIVRSISPLTKIIIGGVGVSDIPEIALNYTGADAVAIGECEAVLPQMLDSVENGTPFEGVPTFVYKKGDNIVTNPKGPIVEDLDSLPLPAYHHFDIDYISRHSFNGEGFRSLHVMTSRGCPFRCDFCINSVLNDNDLLKEIHGEVQVERKSVKQRFRSTESIVAEITMLRDTYGIEDFHFADEEFVSHKRRVFEVCDALRPLNITWSTSARADWADENKLIAMKSSGCRYLLFGVETGSQRMMDMMRKSAKKERVQAGLQNAHKVGMPFISNFIIGHPGEDHETVSETIEFCRVNELLFLPNYLTMYPNSRLFHDFVSQIEDWDEYFGVLGRSDFNRSMLVNMTDLKVKKLKKLRNYGISMTMAYKLVGKERIGLAKLLEPSIRLALIITENSHPLVFRIVRNVVRRLIDLKGISHVAGTTPTYLPTEEKEEECSDGFAESLELLEKEVKHLRS